MSNAKGCTASLMPNKLQRAQPTAIIYLPHRSTPTKLSRPYNKQMVSIIGNTTQRSVRKQCLER